MGPLGSDEGLHVGGVGVDVDVHFTRGLFNLSHLLCSKWEHLKLTFRIGDSLRLPSF